VEEALNHLRQTMQGEDADAIESAMEALNKASHKLAEVMYAEAAKAQQAGVGGAASGPEYVNPGQENGSGPVDADFTVVDDDEGKGPSQN